MNSNISRLALFIFVIPALITIIISFTKYNWIISDIAPFIIFGVGGVTAIVFFATLLYMWVKYLKAKSINKKNEH